MSQLQVGHTLRGEKGYASIRFHTWSHSSVGLESPRSYSGELRKIPWGMPCGGGGIRDGGAEGEGERADIFGPRFNVHLFIQVESSEAYVLIEQSCKPQIHGNV